MEQERAWPLNPITVIKDFNRVREILSVLVRHGFGQLVVVVEHSDTTIGKLVRSSGLTVTTEPEPPTSAAKRIRLVLEELGSTFIKLGQILSTRPDLIPADVIKELTKLHSNVPHIPQAEALALIEAELGRKTDELFAVFEGEHPLGSASIGQVYGAKLPTGEDVVVKVQRPGIKAVIDRDTDILYFLARVIDERLPASRSLGLPGIVKEFHKAIMKELDYRNEARNAVKFAEAFKKQDGVVIPRIYRNLSTQRVLTMDRIRGVKISEPDSLGCDRKVLARAALQAVFVMVFENGFFHADPHPGNIFALPGNRIAFLDLGMVGRLDDYMRFKIADLIIALLDRDIQDVCRVLLSMGVRQGPVQPQQLRTDISEVMDKVIGVPLQDIQFSEILQDLLEGARRNNLKVPSEYMLMGKALLTVESLGKELDPDLEIETELTPYIRRLVTIKYSPKNLTRLLFKRALDWYHWSSELPGHLQTIMEDLETGQLKVRVEQADQGQMLKNVEAIVGKLTAGLIISALLVSSAMFITFSRMEYQFMGLPVTFILGMAGYLGAAILGMRLVRAVVKSRPPQG